MLSQARIKLLTRYVIRCYAVSSITLPLVEGFLENRSIRATSPLLCLWILIIALQHRTKRYLHSKESAKRPQILPVFRSTALQRRHISTSCSQCEMSTFWEWGLGPRDQNTYHLIRHFAFGAGTCSSRENSSLPQICKCKVPGRDITAILQGSQSSLVIFCTTLFENYSITWNKRQKHNFRPASFSMALWKILRHVYARIGWRKSFSFWSDCFL